MQCAPRLRIVMERKDGIPHLVWSKRTDAIQSGVALRFPPHSTMPVCQPYAMSTVLMFVIPHALSTRRLPFRTGWRERVCRGI